MKQRFAKAFAKYLPLIVAVLMVAAPSFAVIVGSLPYTLTNGSTADATQVMANYNKIINDVNTNAAKNGVNSDITAITGLTTPLSAAQGGANVWYGTSASTGTANAQSVATLVPNNFTLVTGNTVSFVAGFTNTGATTLNANGTGATNIFKRTLTGTTALTGGEIVLNTVTVVRYDGTQWQLVGDVPAPFGALTNLASATTTDLGTIASHNINITGTTTITSFGSSATTTFPIYKVLFAGALTLTHNATSLIIPGATNITTSANDVAEVMYLGSGNWRVLRYNYAAVLAGKSAGALQGVQVFTANGTWTRPAGVQSVMFECAGGGGSGAGAGDTAGGQISVGGAGGAGGYARLYVAAAASSYTITIPAAATAPSAAAGNAGGNVTVGAILTCNGGAGGSYTAPAGVTVASADGGAGGTATGGDLNITGTGGQAGILTNASTFSIGTGGSNPLGSGGQISVNAGINVTSGPGSTCGGGGAGANSVGTSGVAQSGGAGGVGCVIAYAYY